MIGQNPIAQMSNMVSAYRGQPEKLQSQVGVPPDLMKLLALQKIEKDRTAAQRELELSMARQQAASGEKTVAQQLEEQVLGSTQKEIAGQLGPLLAKQTNDREQAMRKLVQGIASAPGANSAMQPQAMASGGVVGLAAGGLPGGVGPPEVITEEEIKKAVAKRKAAEAARVAAKVGAPASAAGRAGLVGLLGRAAALPMPLPVKAGLTAASVAVPSLMALIGGDKEPSADTPGAYADPSRARDVIPAAPVAAPPPAPPAPPPPAPRPAPTGVASLPAGRAAKIEEVDTTDLRNRVKGLANTDLATQRQAEEERARAAYGLTPEERAVYERQAQARGAADAERFDPERKRKEALLQFLLGGMGRTSIGGTLGAAGATAFNAAKMAEAEERAAKEERFKQELELMNIGRKAREGAYGAGREAEKTASERQLKGIEALANLGNRDQNLKVEQARLEEQYLDRSSREKIAQMNAELQRAANAANKEQNEELKKQRLQQTFMQFADQKERFLMKESAPAKVIASIRTMQSLGQALSKEQQVQLLQAENDLDKLIRGVHEELTMRLVGVDSGRSGAKVVGTEAANRGP